jgi:multiple sugar transport system ATP-binding protein
MAEIVLKDVAKAYGNVTVLRDITLSIKSGEFVVLVGPSGCGKSTLLRMIAGLEDISAGDITIGGKVVNEIAAKKRDIAMVFQSYALYPHMKVADNMSFSLRLSGVAKPEINRRVAEAAEILGLTDLLDRLPRELSGGQRQRVAMGRAIVRDPRAFLFDEPLSNLDAKLRVKMRGEIKKLHQRLGKTMVYVTHDQTEAMTLADQIVVLNGGRLEQAGPPMELYENPVNLFVASFIGSPEINLIEGQAQGDRFTLPDGTVLPLVAGAHTGPLVYGIRPNHIVLRDGGLPASVGLVEPTGDSQEVQLHFGGREIQIVLHDAAPLHTGDSVTIGWDVARVMLFDPKTGRRLA